MSEMEPSGPDEIQLMADDRGLLVFGSSSAVEQFLQSEGLVASSSSSNGLGLTRLRGLLSSGSAAAQAGSEVSANAGRWVKLSEESAKAIKKYGLRESSKTGLSTGVLKGDKGRVKGFVEFARGPGTSLTNPALLAGAAGIMAQLAMQQTMDEITDYLQRIDAKLDDVLRAQKDSVVSRLVGVGMAIDEALTVSQVRGRVDEVTWSKVQNVPTTIAEVQGYALAQLDGLATNLESAGKVSAIASATSDAAASVQEWLAVLARTFQLQEGFDVLELDRVLEVSPEAVSDHRRGLADARRKRLNDIGASTERLLGRIVAAADTANGKVLLHPSRSPKAVRASERVSGSILKFHDLMELDSRHQSLETRRWSTAAGEARDRALEKGSAGLHRARRGGVVAAGGVRKGIVTAKEATQELPVRLRSRRSTAKGVGDSDEA